jgi:hypothetical protein
VLHAVPSGGEKLNALSANGSHTLSDTGRILEDNGSGAMNRTISLPEELWKKAEELAALRSILDVEPEEYARF